MMEMKITVEAPALTRAIELLAASLTPAGLPVDTGAAPTPVEAPAPTPAPVNPTPAPAAPEVQAVTMAAPVPTAPAPTNTPAAPAPAPAVPVTAAPTYNLDQIARAGASLVDAGKMEQLLALLAKYGVQAVTQLSAEQYGTFATELRALGAQI